MTLLDDARRLVDDGPPTFSAPACGHDAPDYHEDCHFCGALLKGPHREDLGGHESDCPWLAMPGIVAALEAAERVAQANPQVCIPENDDYRNVYTCFACETDDRHAPDCLHQALVSALRSEPVTT